MKKFCIYYYEYYYLRWETYTYGALIYIIINIIAIQFVSWEFEICLMMFGRVQSVVFYLVTLISCELCFWMIFRNSDGLVLLLHAGLYRPLYLSVCN
jgi:hypothetical protein